MYQRKESPLWYVLFTDPETGEHLKRKEHRDKRQAEKIAQDWLLNGVPGDSEAKKLARKVSFCDYLKDFWDFDTSEYFKELQTMGKEPCRRHAREMQKMIDRYYTGYFENLRLIHINEE